MVSIITVLNWVVLAISGGLLLLFLVSSTLEKEYRGSLISLLGIAIDSGLWIGLSLFLHWKWVLVLNGILLASTAIFLLVSLLRFFPPVSPRDLSAALQYDERDHMFSRNHLQFHPQLAEIYYAAHPEKKEIDKKIHAKPELGEAGHSYYDPDYSPVFEAAFTLLHNTRSAAWGEVSPVKNKIDKEKLARVIREMGRFYGAVDVGITPVKPYHVYSHEGRHAENWGDSIRNRHCTAIVIVAAMEVDMIKAAPGLPVILESSRQYVEAAKIANLIAQFLRNLGYQARAHTDGNYQVLCVPTAVDAGLGTLGRIGVFIHPVYGPCVRISVVTTELELPGTTPDFSARAMEHFCRICKKCADNCPTQSIVKEEEPSSRGFRHWSINQEACFSYWKTIGTDCGFCIRVCPYTKPNTLMHKLVRFYISRNTLNQRIALFMDDLFYGRAVGHRRHSTFAFGDQEPLL